MKYLAILALLFLIAALYSPSVYAQTASPSASGKVKQIEDLKDRLATKVAELTKTTRQALYGSVKSISITSLTVETQTKDVKIELLDELAVFQIIKDKRTKLASDDIDKGDHIAVFGDHEDTLDLLKAKVIFIQGALPVRVSGVITEVDKSQYTVTIKGFNNQTYVIDYEKFTTPVTWSQTAGKGKGGFSKFAVGSTIFVIGSPVAKKDNRISATRILDIGNTQNPTPTEAPTAAPQKESTDSAETP